MTTGSLAEILRSAILTVDKGQLEAAQAIGLTNRQAYIRIVFPQALRSALPNLCNLVYQLGQRNLPCLCHDHQGYHRHCQGRSLLWLSIF